MSKKSAGILLYRIVDNTPQFLLVHPGGPLWAKKDAGVWSIPKGEFEDEDVLQAAKREFFEEIGKPIDGEFIPLTPHKLKNGKTVYPFAIEGTLDEKSIHSNTFELEWPPKSGQRQSFPEIDRAGWFTETEAKEKIIAGQIVMIDELIGYLNVQSS